MKLQRTAQQKALIEKHGIEAGEGWLIIQAGDEDGAGDMNEEGERQLALEVAKALGGKAARNSRQVFLNEPFCPWAIPLDNKQFRARVCISDSMYSFEAKHRKGEKALLEEALFCVSFKVQDGVMFTRDRVGKVSKVLGVPVYRQGFVDDEVVEKWLLSKPVQDRIRMIDFGALSRLFMSPIQLEATSQLKSAEACGSQVRLFMDLLRVLACARKPERERKSG